MHFAMAEEQVALQEVARKVLEEHSKSDRVRTVMASDSGFDAPLWKRMGDELGWLALTVPEQYSGLGCSSVELAALLEVTGAYLPCVPLFSHLCLGISALLLGGTDDQKDQYLEPLASGVYAATLALLEPGSGFHLDRIQTQARHEGADVVLSGHKTLVLDALLAGLFVVVARAPHTSALEGIELYLVPADAPGLSCSSQRTLDLTRRCGELRLNEVRVPAGARLGQDQDGHHLLETILQHAAIGLAAEAVGGAQRCLDMAVDYARVRVQFNRPIGSFQAIKHKCADMMLRVESARSAAYAAAWAAAHAPEELLELSSIALAYCTEAYFHCAAENIQIHGGIGFTWEHDAHLFLKRARATEQFLGSPSYHREKLARHLKL